MTKDEALRLAWDALHQIAEVSATDYEYQQWASEAITAIKAVLEAKDEPVACADNGVVNWIADKQFMHEAELYTTPPQRTWVGLTDDEQRNIAYSDINCWDWGELMDAVEAKLKEKNT